MVRPLWLIDILPIPENFDPVLSQSNRLRVEIMLKPSMLNPQCQSLDASFQY